MLPVAIKFSQAASLQSLVSGRQQFLQSNVPVPSLGKLKLDDWHDSLVVSGREIHALEDRDAIRHHCSADKCVGVGSPAHTGSLGITEVDSGQPARGISLVCSGLDRRGECLGPGLSIGKRVTASVFLGHVGVPDVVEVGGGGFEGYIDVVTSII